MCDLLITLVLEEAEMEHCIYSVYWGVLLGSVLKRVELGHLTTLTIRSISKYFPSIQINT
jgi:hypothetical protein